MKRNFGKQEELSSSKFVCLVLCVYDLAFLFVKLFVFSFLGKFGGIREIL